MSVIAIARVPKSMNANYLMKHLKSTIKGHIDFMNFIIIKQDKTAFVRLSEKLDPQEVVEIINSNDKRGSLRAYIPEEIPDIPVKRRRMSMKGMLVVCVCVLLQELQTKFAGLFDLSASTGHKLMNDIAKIVSKRCYKILDQAGDEVINTSLLMTKAYRKRYPHFADFQLILSTLRSIQDAEGLPRDPIQESDLTSYTLQSYVVDNIPFDQVRNAYNKYLDKVSVTVTDHIKNLEMTPKNTSPEEIARIKIREQLQSILPYIPICMKYATSRYFIPQESNYYYVHVFGEPDLPSQDAIKAFLKRHKAMSTKRSDRIYNMIIVEVPKSQYMSILNADGTLVAGAKLVIRPSNLPTYRVPHTVIKDILSRKLSLADGQGEISEDI